jgi:hypothetical protein
MTVSHSDEKLAQVLALHGPEGYGFWWLLVEVVAQQTGKDDDKCSVAYPASYWMRITGVYHFKKMKMLVESMHNLSLIYAQCSSNLCNISALSQKDILTISMPNILKYRDEYSKKSGQNPESVRSKKEKQKEITELDTEKEKTTAVAANFFTVSDVQSLMSKNMGKLVISGGQIDIIRTMIKTYPAEKIIEAFEAAGAKGDVSSLNWILCRLENKPNGQKPTGNNSGHIQGIGHQPGYLESRSDPDWVT